MPRIIYIVTGGAYLAVYLYYIKNGIKKIYINEMVGEGYWKIPVTEIIIMTIGILLALFYFYVCFGDVKSSLKKLR